jgi:hypothetical protein
MRIAVLGIVASGGAVVSASAQETVSIAVPVAISFEVTDVSRSTSGTPSVTTVSFSNPNLSPGKALRVSVQSDAVAFTAPSGPSIPASNVSWSNLGASGGIGWNGTLGSSFYTLVYQSDPARTSGHVDLGWTLAAPASGIRAGSHQLTIRWKVESITP